MSAPTSAPMLSARDLSRWYGEVIGLNAVTFDTRSPIVGLLGPNGSGKSTMLNLVTGQLKPSGGELRVLGETPWGNRPLMARVGFVPEIDTFWEWMTGLDFVTRMARLHGFEPGEAAKRAQGALREAQLQEEAWHRPLGTYSRGMRQKTKIAQAIVHDPQLLVLDEPLTGADPVSRRHLNEVVRARAKAGARVIFSSHILHEVEALTEEVLVLSRGRLVARGRVADIRALIDEHPHRIRMVVSDPRLVAREVLAEKGVVSVKLGPRPDELVVETREPDAFHARVPALCLDKGLRLTHLSASDESLQAVFDYLFEGRREADA
ncbi:MAG TPA: ABC transporter ATP-binding protein [Candidatus Thermoplasmatota archaeon]|nr:ABC transporter ATP-binding protein [Candidatus Thermoplasmatota archaeon]